jgi:hypothetical protein
MGGGCEIEEREMEGERNRGRRGKRKIKIGE